MDTLFFVVASDIISRLISFLVTKYKNPSTADKLERLQGMLLRARTIVEEAQGRQISNQGMLLQLRKLMVGMYQGYYILDTFQEPHTTSTRTHSTARQSRKQKKLQVAMEGMEATINDMKEFIVFLLDCPGLPRQPYNAHLFMEKCMFGRYEEKELIRDFLLQPCDSPLSVLPIIGPREVGKNTLIEHVYNEESVREHFSQIVRFKSDYLNNEENESFIKGRELVVSSVKSLVVVELVSDDINDEAWRRFCSSIDSGCSKMIVIGRVETISRLGTTQAIKLKRLRRHEFWYFFRTLAFGSANPEEHPELLRISRKIAHKSKVLS
ncbi:hypothetical protein E2562_005911 [Oryza meyeriana var. granulata]|uniref:Rx N-terminal domain-containing protein n=1 Tax=Oryza meyeriana var. granulata TaxID=110450 RepID=A0A6G1DUK8_9ORYZ|nr:hypothetical protein E2562_005911 [Oryza meyeriana var. granulata]